MSMDTHCWHQTGTERMRHTHCWHQPVFSAAHATHPLLAPTSVHHMRHPQCTTRTHLVPSSAAMDRYRGSA